MAWVVKMTDSAGNAFFGTSPDHEGLRYSCYKAVDAEKFETKAAAEAVFYWFHQIKDLQKFKLEAVEA